MSELFIIKRSLELSNQEYKGRLCLSCEGSGKGFCSECACKNCGGSGTK